jgi:Ser/Thr protein kinase RdoA (MazF antagonist)
MVAAAGAVVEGVHRYRRLTDNEIGVFNVLRRLVQGGSIYKVWIAQDRLLDAMDSEMDRDDRERLLANMKSKGILDEGANKWRAVW